MKNYYNFILHAYFNKLEQEKDNQIPSTPNMKEMNLAAFHFSRVSP